MSEYIGVVTNAGQAKIAASIGGTALNLTTIRVGDGNGAAITPNPAMTDLVRRVGNAYAIVSSGRDPTNANYWRISAIIPVNDGPFDIREIGVWDTAGDLIAVAKHVLVEKRTPAQGAAVELTTDIVFPVSDTAQVTVTLQPSGSVSIFQLLRAGFTVVESATVTAAPANPAIGRTHVVPADPTGVWAGLAGYLVQWNGTAWVAVNVPEGFVVVDQSKEEAASARWLRRTAAGWASALASPAAIGLIRLATEAEALARTATNCAVTPASLGQSITEMSAKMPLYPNVQGAGTIAVTAAGGNIVVDTGQSWQHRGLLSYSSDNVVAGERTFATAANKTFHLVWDAPGTGLATPTATYPFGRWSLIDRTGATPAETDPTYDTTYDRMLTHRVVTNGANAATITALVNRASLSGQISRAISVSTVTTGWGVSSHTFNWSRVPRCAITSWNVNSSSTSQTSEIVSVDAVTRYGAALTCPGYAESDASPYVTGAMIVDLSA